MANLPTMIDFFDDRFFEEKDTEYQVLDWFIGENRDFFSEEREICKTKEGKKKIKP